MRGTVGPLPPAVYWQRRAMLLAALVFILVTFATCAFGGSGGAASKQGAAAASSPSSSPSSPQPIQDGTPEHPFLTSPAPDTATPSAVASAAASAAPSASPSPSPSPTARPCADGDLTLVASLTAPTWKAGTMPHMQLAVTNSSKVACSRDLGATQQELRVMAGATRVWSSDDCQPTTGVAQTTLAPGQTQVFKLIWSGKSSVPQCAATRVQQKAGSYQLFARLGTLLSKPTPFTIT